jgi:hypothetical protein
MKQFEEERQSQYLSQAIALFISALQDLEKDEEILPSNISEVGEEDKRILGNCNNAIIQLRIASGFLKRTSEVSRQQIILNLLGWYGTRGNCKYTIVDSLFCTLLKNGYQIETKKVSILHGIRPTEKDLNSLATIFVVEKESVENRSNPFDIKNRKVENKDIPKGIERLISIDGNLFKALSKKNGDLIEYIPKRHNLQKLQHHSNSCDYEKVICPVCNGHGYIENKNQSINNRNQCFDSERIDFQTYNGSGDDNKNQLEDGLKS